MKTVGEHKATVRLHKEVSVEIPVTVVPDAPIEAPVVEEKPVEAPKPEEKPVEAPKPKKPAPKRGAFLDTESSISIK